jgi:hypothetical protein
MTLLDQPLNVAGIWQRLRISVLLRPAVNAASKVMVPWNMTECSWLRPYDQRFSGWQVAMWWPRSFLVKLPSFNKINPTFEGDCHG